MTFERPSRELSVDEIILLALDLYGRKFLQFFLPFLAAGVTMGISTYVITSSFPLPSPPIIPASPSTRLIYEKLLPWFLEFISKAIVIALLSGLVSWIVGTTVTSVVIKAASDEIEKGASNLGGSFIFAMSRLPSLLAAQFVAGILTAIGLILFVVPGVIIAIMFSLIFPVIIVEQKGTFESLGRSRKLVSKRWLKTFALLLILGVVILIISVIANMLANSFGAVHPILTRLFTNIISAFLGPLYPIAITYLYYALAAREKPSPSSSPTGLQSNIT